MLRCPACHEPPDALHLWRCACCEERFDPFAVRGCCPRCASIAQETRCPACEEPSRPTRSGTSIQGVREAYLRSGEGRTRVSTRPINVVRAQVFLDADALAAAAPDQRAALESKTGGVAQGL